MLIYQRNLRNDPGDQIMIRPELFFEELNKCGVNFFTGVPDSLLKSFCAFINENINPDRHVIAANEGAAISLGIGHHLGSGEVPLIYMQNSGLGNCVNPLLSLASPEVYGIPMLMLIGWRGEPLLTDEPQHKHQGRVTLPLLEAMDITYFILEDDISSVTRQIKEALKKARETQTPVALVVRKGTFEKYGNSTPEVDFPITREDAIVAAASGIDQDAIVVSTTGMASRELFEYRASKKLGHQSDFLTVGGMGHASQIAMGIAISQPQKKVYCFDGDGSVIMHMGSLGIIGQSKCNNLTHLVFNNGAHASVGGQSTVGFAIDLCQIAKACGYSSSCRINRLAELREVLQQSNSQFGPSFIEVRTSKSNRSDIGRPTSSPKQNKLDLMNFLGV